MCRKALLYAAHAKQRMRVAISRFAELALCEYKVYLRFVAAAEPRPSFWQRQRMIAGSAQHAASKRLEPEMPALSRDEVLQKLLDAESTLEFPSESVFVRFGYDKHTFSGRIDKLRKERTTALVIDEKYVSTAHGAVQPHHALQLNAYCRALADGALSCGRMELGARLLAGKQILHQIVERHRETREILFASEPQPYAAIDASLQRFCAILEGEAEPVKSTGSRCAWCEFGVACARNSL